MLVDLYERPNSVEAPRSRALIDKVFSLASPDGGIVNSEDGVSVQRPLREGGREAWDMMRRLRQKAWQRAGLDPDILWTEQDQIQAGVAQPPSSGEMMLRAIRENTIYSKEPGSSLNDENSQPTSLDAFHGLLKAAQNDIEAAEEIQKQKSEGRQSSLPNSNARPANASPPNPTTVRPIAPPQQPQRFHPRSSSFDFQQNNWRSTATNGVPQAPDYSNFSFPTQPLPQSNMITPAVSLYASPTTATTTLSNPVSMSMPQQAATNIMPSDIGGMPVSDGMGLGDTPPAAVGIPGMKDDDSPGFDWKQWDAVFGHYVPVDDFMDLDTAAGWSLGSWDGTTLG
jgi:hypothetical protein